MYRKSEILLNFITISDLQIIIKDKITFIILPFSDISVIVNTTLKRS